MANIMEVLPKYIEGIPTTNSAKAERIVLITNYYIKLLSELQREHNNSKGNNYIVNDYLQAQVFINDDGIKKARNSSANTWKSTYAVKRLKEIVKNAKPLEGKGLEVDIIHGNTQRKNSYIKTIILYYELKSKKNPYLNFWVKLTIGVLNNGKHIQYAVNKIELT